MKHMTAEELYDKLKGKPYVEWTDLVQAIGDEFHVNLVVEEIPDDEDVIAIAEAPDVLRQIRMSKQDRENGRVYGQEDGLKYLRERIQGAERG